MPQPQLGYGKQTEVSLDAANQWMRSQPWWQQIKGTNAKLNDAQRRQIQQAAQAHGIVIDEGDVNIDSTGNLDNKGHKLRNGIIVAGIAAAAIAAPYVIPHLASAASAAAPAASAGTLAGVEGGAYGLSSGALAGLGTGAMGAVPVAGAVGAGTAGTLGTMGKIGSILSGGKGVSGYLDTAGRVADALGGLSSGRAAGRQAENQAAYFGDRNIIDLYKAQQDAAVARSDADLRQKKYTLDAPQLRATNSVRGDILANAQDVHIQAPSTIPEFTISGGLRPSMFSANTRALGGLMSQQALDSQNAGDTFSPLPDATAPQLTQVSQPGKLDSFLNIAGSIGSLASLIPYTRTKKPVQPSYYDYNESGGG